MTINQHISTAKKRPVLTGLVAVLAVVSTGAAFAFATGMTAPQMAAAFVPLPPCCVIVPPPPPPPPPPPVVIPPVVIPEPEPLPPCCEIVPAPVTTPPVTQPPVQPPAVVVEPEPEPPIIVNPPYVPPVDVVDVIDVCLNIDGIQPSIPHGMVKKNGKCVTPEPEPAPVCTLAISRSSIDRGQSATLTWTTDNATSVRIDQGVGSVSLNGSRAVSPQSSTTYTLTATGNGKTVYCTTAITVTVVPDAPVCTLT
ncbi:MAG TPA: hypothetical protein VHO23_03520, partial [Candidatus Paceibacterota bacterium]|nr:hypothetical protein [Candidatus Paceibacterota bacterium]